MGCRIWDVEGWMQDMGYRMWNMSYGGMQDLESGMWEVGWKI